MGLLLELGSDLLVLVTPPPPPPSPLRGHEPPLQADGYAMRDFATGLVQLNRDYCRVAELPDAQRQKMLFGSDFVVP